MHGFCTPSGVNVRAKVKVALALDTRYVVAKERTFVGQASLPVCPVQASLLATSKWIAINAA